MGEGIFRMDGSRVGLARALGDDEAAWRNAKGPLGDPSYRSQFDPQALAQYGIKLDFATGNQRQQE